MKNKETKYWETDEFKSLQKEWYNNLKNKGFVDIEDQETGIVERPFSHKTTTADVQYEARAEYFRMASQFIWDHNFKKPQHKAVWTLHAEGRTVRSIATSFKMWPTTVQRIINKYRKIMLKDVK